MNLFIALCVSTLLASSGSEREREKDRDTAHEKEHGQEHGAPPAAAQEASPGHEVPPGSAEELALWERGVNSTRLLHAARDRSTKLQLRAKTRGTLAELQRLAATDGPAGREARAARERIITAGQNVVAMLKRQWPIDPLRGCSAAVIDYESQLWNKNKSTREVYLPPSQRALGNCVGKADTVLKAMASVNSELEAAVVAGEALAGTATVTGTAGRPDAKGATK